MTAYHFPALVGSSGMQRTLRFVQPLALNAHPRATCSSRGPDWAGWPSPTAKSIGSSTLCVKMSSCLRNSSPTCVIWSTHPIATGHVIASKQLSEALGRLQKAGILRPANCLCAFGNRCTMTCYKAWTKPTAHMVLSSFADHTVPRGAVGNARG